MRRSINKQDIIQAGLELMFLNGYNATGVKEITDEVEIPKGSFYNHFQNKEEFGLQVLKSYCENDIKLYKEHFIKQDESPLMRFESFFNTRIRNYNENLNCKLGCLMSNFSVEMADVNHKFQHLLDEEFSRCQDIITQCLEEAKELGHLPTESDTDELAAYILNGWHGALVRMKSTGNVIPLETFKKLTLEKLLV